MLSKPYGSCSLLRLCVSLPSSVYLVCVSPHSFPVCCRNLCLMFQPFSSVYSLWTLESLVLNLAFFFGLWICLPVVNGFSSFTLACLTFRYALRFFLCYRNDRTTPAQVLLPGSGSSFLVFWLHKCDLMSNAS